MQPSYTMIKSHLHWHYAVPRQLSQLEAALLASYPEDFRWVGSKDDWKERIGNSVPPLFMRAIAEHIREHILSAAPALHAQAAD